MAKKGIAEHEYHNQKKTLDGLPSNFEYPLFNGWQAIQSQRKSGYQTTARAAREIVDNAIEAGAENVHIVFETISEKDRKPFQRKNSVTAIAFIDDGTGMLHESNERSILRYSLSWGGGTHFDDPRLIGKFGFGLPNSSVNQTQYTEVYTRTDPGKEWDMATLDVRREAVDQSGVVRAGTVTKKPLPKFVQDYLRERKINLNTGTVVVWCQPDRLTTSTRAALREHIEHDFQVVYRGLLDGVNIFVGSEEPVFKVDPTFLTPESYLYLSEQAGGAVSLYDEHLLVLHYLEESSGQPRLMLVGPERGKDPLTAINYDISLKEAKEEEASPPPGKRGVGLSTIHVRASYLPYPEFMRDEKGNVRTDAGRRFNIRKRTRGISFVRSGREIDTKDSFPKSNRKELGTWPLLAGYDYYWGLEAMFDPGLDEVLGIGHDKQTVAPIEDFWKVLHQAGVDLALARSRGLRHKAGEENKKRQAEAADVDAAAEEAAEQATKFEPPVVPGSRKSKAQAKASEAAESAVAEASPTAPLAIEPSEIAKPDSPTPEDGLAETAGDPASAGCGDQPEASQEPDTRKRPKKRFMIEKFSDPNGPFMEPKAGADNSVIARVNTAHPWFSAYATPRSLTEARNATNLLLLALAATEVRASDDKQVWLEQVRRNDLTPFLRATSRLLKQFVPQDDEEEND